MNFNFTDEKKIFLLLCSNELFNMGNSTYLPSGLLGSWLRKLRGG